MTHIHFPKFFYGTAWKEDKTADLTFSAIENGFRAIDTANQRKHYFEEGVGLGLWRGLEKLSLKREDIFLQTKFTYARGQDHRKPYDENDSFTKQVVDSFQSSLVHLNTNYIDSLVLHGPSGSFGITDADHEVWRAMENLLAKGQVRHLGVSNISYKQLTELCQKVRIKPSFVQNRCYARQGWDSATRAICAKEQIAYQGFSLLTANQNELSESRVLEIAFKYQKTIPQIVFRFCHQIGMICLTGTTNPVHMRQDLDVFDFQLTDDEISLVMNIGI